MPRRLTSTGHCVCSPASPTVALATRRQSANATESVPLPSAWQNRTPSRLRRRHAASLSCWPRATRGSATRSTRASSLFYPATPPRPNSSLSSPSAYFRLFVLCLLNFVPVLSCCQLSR
uniref:TIR domain-containing protein n=1 Tax=Mesocestoides corti TaxID=53468 RepID=A0A5K3EY56_MESCO